MAPRSSNTRFCSTETVATLDNHSRSKISGIHTPKFLIQKIKNGAANSPIVLDPPGLPLKNRAGLEMIRNERNAELLREALRSPIKRASVCAVAASPKNEEANQELH